MIASVRGKVKGRAADHVVVECGGVGYRLNVSAQTLGGVPVPGRETSLFAHLVVRDDAHHLYGFAGEDERELFLRLISVAGVGPKMALAVLSGSSAPEVARAIAAGDSKRFQVVPGVGKKTAERIIVELREKVAGRVDDEIVVTRAADRSPRALAREALLGLGFAPQETDEMLDGAEGETAEDLIAEALRAAR
jgi:holliday junction DNA helicase RuvA